MRRRERSRLQGCVAWLLNSVRRFLTRDHRVRQRVRNRHNWEGTLASRVSTGQRFGESTYVISRTGCDLSSRDTSPKRQRGTTALTVFPTKECDVKSMQLLSLARGLVLFGAGVGFAFPHRLRSRSQWSSGADRTSGGTFSQASRKAARSWGDPVGDTHLVWAPFDLDGFLCPLNRDHQLETTSWGHTPCVATPFGALAMRCS
jgi:hypothetical protein